MNFRVTHLAVTVLLVVSCNVNAANAQSSPNMSFFVSSAKSKTGNLGGLHGADRICQNLAAAVGLGNKTWRAYLSVERDPENKPN